jgi:hypothetical protein
VAGELDLLQVGFEVDAGVSFRDFARPLAFEKRSLPGHRLCENIGRSFDLGDFLIKRPALSLNRLDAVVEYGVGFRDVGGSSSTSSARSASFRLAATAAFASLMARAMLPTVSG